MTDFDPLPPQEPTRVAPVDFQWGPPPPVLEQAPERPRVWTVFVTFVLALVATIAVQILFVTVLLLASGGPASHHGDASQEALMVRVMQPIILFPSLILSQLTIAAACIIPAWLSRMPLIDRLRLRGSNNSYFMLVLMGLATLCLAGFLTFAYDALNSVVPLPRSQTLEPLNKMMSQLRGESLLAAVLVIGVLPGICEELLCRGYIQTRLRQRWGIVPSILITSLLFAILHMDLVQGAIVFFLGLYLGYVAERSGSIRASMVCHATNNVAATLLAAGIASLAHSSSAGTQPSDEGLGFLLVMLAAFAVGFVLLNVWLHFLFRKHPGLPMPPYIGAPVLYYPPSGYFGATPPPLPEVVPGIELPRDDGPAI